MPARKRILYLLVGSVAVIGIYLWFLRVTTGYALEARSIGWRIQVVKKTPVLLTDLSVSSTGGTKFSFARYDFDLPWDDLDPSKTKIVGKMQVIVFRSGKTMLVSHSHPRDFVRVVLHSGFDRDAFEAIYGPDPLHSDYAMYETVLRATPAQVTPFLPKSEAAGRLMMLNIKAIAVPSSPDTDVLAIRSPYLKGFQYGDPRKAPPRIVLDLFADDGGLEFNISRPNNTSAPAITQPDLNRIIQTARKTPDLR